MVNSFAQIGIFRTLEGGIFFRSSEFSGYIYSQKQTMSRESSPSPSESTSDESQDAQTSGESQRMELEREASVGDSADESTTLTNNEEGSCSADELQGNVPGPSKDGITYFAPYDRVGIGNIFVSWSKRFCCFYCNYSTGLKSNLKLHIKAKHSSERPIKCPHCEYSTTQFSSQSAHINYYHRDKPFPCPFYDVCSFSAINQYIVDKHVRAEHLKRLFRCLYCDYSDSNFNVFNRHVETKHTEVKPFTCAICRYSRMDNATVRDHIMAKHLKDRQFTCSLCNYCFARHEDLKEHVSATHVLETITAVMSPPNRFEQVMTEVKSKKPKKRKRKGW